MASEDNHKASDNPSQCANTGCGFYGRPITLNLCSKCYKDYCLQQEQRLRPIRTSVKDYSSRCSSPVVSVGSIVVYGMKNRCECCKKRVKTLGFKCRCGSSFCSEHRYPEMHACSFDFKAVGRDAIDKANSVIKPDKIQRF